MQLKVSVFGYFIYGGNHIYHTSNNHNLHVVQSSTSISLLSAITESQESSTMPEFMRMFLHVLVISYQVAIFRKSNAVSSGK